MRGINDKCIDLIYLDPPFKSDAKYGEIFDPDNEEKREIFRDIWDLKEYDLAWWGKIKEDNEGLYYYLGSVREIHSPSMMSYLIYMAMRINQMHRILKPTGSIYLHCDHHASHYLKPLMDAIFGHRNFRNEIVWSYNRFSRRGDAYARMHDVILFYGKSDEITFNKPVVEARDTNRYEKGYHTVTDSGVTKLLVYDEKKAVSKIEEAERIGREIRYTEASQPTMGTVWTDIPILNPQSKERKKAGNYPTVKPLALLNRIILASSNAGDMVLDPFCGCATTCEAADNQGRHWVGIDISDEAARLVQKRIESDIFRRNFKQYNTLPILTDRKPSKPYNHPDNIFTMIGRQLSYCFLCFKKKDIEDLCVDHIVAKSRGGSDFLDNLQMVCHKCNSAKGNKTNEEALAEQWKKDGVEWERRKFEVEQKILVALKKKSKLEIM